MTLGEFWNSSLSDWIVLAMIPLNLACLMFSLYLIRHHLDTMMDALKNSRFIYLWAPAWRNRGCFGGFVLLSKIAGMVIFSNAYIRIGDVDAVDIKHFPHYLKRLLIIDITLMTFTLAWMGVVAALIKFK
ncbi:MULTISPECIES: hypothetical protein [Pseudomonas]|jgi:hypothetical protein|uniref:hypothetical protein n=1 Tax=Pseudomonas TaxID=286 RepID=UPI0018E5DA4B|nr:MULTISPECIES: hypothetical protein [Pseudomonas]MBI6621419.1 hypothetical protein [Pseudomonas corrugata]MBI6695301.1 hypothetical protein [Pseudomonas corrugata]WRV68649.1 hypothetical protein VQ575_00910 [Pseudomonas frederiksbergensis]